MTADQWIALLPLLITAGGALAVMAGIAIRRSHAASTYISIAALAGSALAAVLVMEGPHEYQWRQVSSLLLIDSYAATMMALAALAALAVVMLASSYIRSASHESEEFFILLLLSTTGAQVLAASTHFASFILGLELLTVPLFGMIPYRRGDAAAVEAGIKYLVLAAVATTFLLFGMALVYAATGTMELEGLAASTRHGLGALASAGVAMLLIGVAFKLALAPLYFWTPDVFQGAPAPVGGFLATVSKGAVFAVLLRYYVRMDLGGHQNVWLLLYAVAVATMFAGNLLALRQKDLKRLLGCSSIAQMGYLLVPLLAGGPRSAEAIVFYLAAYTATVLAAFGVIAMLARDGEDPQKLSALRGLAWRRPVLAGVLTVSMLSLAGMPLTAGFVAKFYAVLAGVGGSLWALILVLLANSVISLYYYLRVVVALYEERTAQTVMPDATARTTAAQDAFPARLAAPQLPFAPSGGLLAALAVAAMAIAMIWLGLQPGPLTGVIQAAVHSLF